MRIDLMITVASALFLPHVREVLCDSLIMGVQPYDKDDDILTQQPRQKKPFCNAFTGCGRKRSDDSVAMLVEMDPEVAAAAAAASSFDQSVNNLRRMLQEAEARIETLSTRPAPVPTQRKMIERSIDGSKSGGDGASARYGANYVKPRWMIEEAETNRGLLRAPSNLKYMPSTNKMRTSSESEYVIVAADAGDPPSLHLRTAHSRDPEMLKSSYDKGNIAKTLRFKFQ